MFCLREWRTNDSLGGKFCLGRDTEICIINKFFYISPGEYLLKQKVVVVQIFQWKFKANVARNASFEVRLWQNVCPIWVKNGKKLIVFGSFTLVSQS